MRKEKNLLGLLAIVSVLSVALGFNYKSSQEVLKYSLIKSSLNSYKKPLPGGNNENVELDFAFKEFKLDSIFRRLNSANRFNGCVLVAQHGKIIYRNSLGVANPILGEPLQINSVFQLASVSKTITGVSVMILAEQNKVFLDDPYSLYFPSFPYKSITVRELLSHTSGVPDYTKMSANYFPSGVDYYNNQDVLNAMQIAQLPLSFSPGSKFRYNNSNYALLALLVEKQSGMKFADFVAKNIFKPLEMTDSYIAFPEEVWAMTNRTFGFSRGNRIHDNDRFDGVFGDKGAYSTIDDMFKFDRALYPGVLLSENSINELFSNNLNGIRTTKKYACGFRLREDHNHQRIIYHNGWWHGYRTAFHRRESDNSCVVILSNHLDYDVYSKAKEIFNILDNYYPDMYSNSTAANDEDL